MTPAQLRAWRKERGLIQRDLGALLGLSKRTYLHLERGDSRGGKQHATIPRQVELALRGLDAEMAAAFEAHDMPSLRAAYAKAIVNIEQTTPEARHEGLGYGSKVLKKSA